MSKTNKLNNPGAAASRSRSTQKVLDIERRFIDASKSEIIVGSVATCSVIGMQYVAATVFIDLTEETQNA